MTTNTTERLGDSIVDTYKDWEVGEYRFTNTKTKNWYWVANGASFLNYNGANVFTQKEKRILWKAICEAVKRKAVGELNQ